ncbi:hypothetical protein [Limosilactobacillus vaginalis]|uniref:hypothetical protein n=1 Tax=Limosilactobacillus vaginalis TaxID=1633 RepID=UPI00265DBBA2|nr:hypothetical protein [Limosilactobacillus vaginalis]
MTKRVVDSPLYTVPEGAKYLKTDIVLVRKAINKGYLKTFDFGSTKLYRPEMDRFIVKYMGDGKGKKLKELLEEDDKPLKEGERRVKV